MPAGRGLRTNGIAWLHRVMFNTRKMLTPHLSISAHEVMLRRVGPGGRPAAVLREGDALSLIEGRAVTIAAHRFKWRGRGIVLVVRRFTPGLEGRAGKVGEGVELELEEGMDAVSAGRVLSLAVQVSVEHAELARVLPAQVKKPLGWHSRRQRSL